MSQAQGDLAQDPTAPEIQMAHDGPQEKQAKRPWWKLKGRRAETGVAKSRKLEYEDENEPAPLEKWSLGILNDRRTEEVPGTVLLLSANRNEPLGMRHAQRNTSESSMPSPYPSRPSSRRAKSPKKSTNGQVILEPQPDDSMNDPLNWPAWRRDSALLSLGFYCMLGGGITPILAAGFSNVSQDFGVSVDRVALTTGLFMMGMGLGGVIASPTAILFGKRPVYLAAAVIFILASVWCAESPNFANLIVARIFQGMAISPVECLPSATIAEIFFLHERAFRIGIYTLLLLSGKNLVPLVSAAVIQSLGWRWVFWMVAIIAAFGVALLFLFVPETFWDRTPHRKPAKTKRPSAHRSISNILRSKTDRPGSQSNPAEGGNGKGEDAMTPRQRRLHQRDFHVGFSESMDGAVDGPGERPQMRLPDLDQAASFPWTDRMTPKEGTPDTPFLHNMNSPYYLGLEKNTDYLTHHVNSKTTSEDVEPSPNTLSSLPEKSDPVSKEPEPLDPAVATKPVEDPEKALPLMAAPETDAPLTLQYTNQLRHAPAKTFRQTLRPHNGRLSHANWFSVAFRPFVLYTYPSILWSSIIYACSIGWLIVLSESLTTLFRSKDTYNFSALQVGIMYISPFIGGVLGTAVAGRVSDIIVRYMARRNGGVYEPEYRLLMSIPILISTAIGLMGFGWSVEVHDASIVPTIFFGVISFGCSLGSTTAITFAVDSYRQYAGEALVTLNFTKNIFHGLVWSLFFPDWLAEDGAKTVFLVIGGIQIAACLTTIPMYIFGKRLRMWTVRRAATDRF